MDMRTYYVVRPKLRGYAIILGVLILVLIVSGFYFTESGSLMYIIAAAFAFAGICFIFLRMLSLSFYTYKITDAYVEKSRRFIVDNVHKMPIRRVQSYEIHAGLLDKLAGTATVVLKHGGLDRPTLSLNSVGTEYIEGIENTIELIIRRDIKGPRDFSTTIMERRI